MRNAKFSRSRRGAALIIALAIMVLVLALVVGILSRVSTERSAAGGYASSVGARLLADTAVQLVQAQIDTATSGGTTMAWASQPGLIRTFNNSGEPAKSYKLYSSNTMQMVGALNPATEAAELSEWFNNPALYTDINMPVDTNFDGTPDIWPILDPAAAGSVEGFAITGAPTGKYLGIQNAAPMPVRWLYVLKDGQVVAPTATGSVASIDAATDTNPIVGRIAFWTDDETCKVNVNTASEGTYWDVPKFVNITDQNLGIYQPVKNEFQGYPGHPAGVSLSTVFPNLVGESQATANDKVYALTPRIAAGGSLNLTKPATDTLAPVTFDQDRLYANDDELIFNKDRQANNGLTSAEIERAKFFITTTSRAPEVNLFNLPKVVCWPIHSDALSHRSAFDKLIAFCGTLNGAQYYFQRKNKDSSTEDYTEIIRNQELYSYLQALTDRPIPGFGGSLRAKLGADRDQILTEIFDYIRITNLNDQNFTDKSKQFAPGTGNRTIGQGEVVPITIGSTRGFGRYVTISEVGLWLICTADPMTVASNDPTTNKTLATGTPLVMDTPVNTKQLRIEAALILDPFTPMHGFVPMHPDIEITIEGLENWTIQGDKDGVATNLGFPALIRQTDTDAGVFRLGISPAWAGVPDTGGYLGVTWAGFQRQSRARNGGRLALDGAFSGSIDSSGVKNQQNPFIGEPVTITVNKATPRMTIQGPPITISIRHRTTGKLIQTIGMEFPSTAAPAPRLSTTTVSPVGWSFQQTGAGVGSTPETAATGRFTTAGPKIDRNNDFLYSLVASPKASNQTLDPRFLAMSETVDKTLFTLHPKANGTRSFAHSIIASPMLGFGGLTPSTENGNTGTLTSLGSGNFYPFNSQPCPKVPFPANAAVANGDWDNGVGALPDGGFLNEPDQGNLANSSGGGTSFGYSTPYFSAHNKISTASANFTSPSRTMPSPGMFGSLPSGFKRDLGWQTLLFRRQPTHPSYAVTNGGFINNPDYLFLDFFWMPVVEPYAISEPLSTAGKINMNSQIIPFTYIQRDTGLSAALKNERVISVPTVDYNGVYKKTVAGAPNEFNTTANYRRKVKISETLQQFKQRFDNSDGTGLYAFRTAAEICDMHIIPDDAAVDISSRTTIDNSMASYWASHALTGDNSRERIYTTLYPRLTTKSNTYTVYFRAQSLKKRAGSDPKIWDDTKDAVVGDYRGSTTLERYIDPNNSSIPDYGANPDASPTLDSLYKWRLRAQRQFSP